MKKDDAKQSQQPLEGEGNYTATRRYNEHLGDAIDAGDLEAAADAARRAMEGPERAELERAAKRGKAGPKHVATTRASQKPTSPGSSK
jgi:hypothetical protein